MEPLLRNATFHDFVLLRIDRRIKTPLNRQIYQAIREGILSSALPARLQLPSSRQLADELSTSRNTVLFAYQQLMAEGYLDTQTGAGTFVADTTPDQTIGLPARGNIIGKTAGKSELSARGEALVKQAGSSELQWGAFMPGVPDVTLFPHAIWQRLHSRHWRRSDSHLLTYGPGGGYFPLREAIADHVRVTRSVKCTPEQILITAGTHQSIDLLLRMLSEPEDVAWIEDPCYWGTHSVLQSHGLQSLPIPVDEEGMQINIGSAIKTAPRFIFVTPSHQYPLGPVMSLSRRRMLLEYAAAHQIWIVEDDYDSEFRYGTRPLASLQGMDSKDRVLYLGTFSKTLFPGLRIGFIVVPEALIQPFATGISELYRGGQLFLQAVLADFIKEGHFSSHIRRMRQLYAERLRVLQETIAHTLGAQVNISGSDAGLHLTLMLPDSCDDKLISNEARAAGIIARPLSTYYLDPGRARRGLVLGYACVASDGIVSSFAKLATIIKVHCRFGSD
jgi:GntR family transcriptional regulator / MocR family aminotransferase